MVSTLPIQIMKFPVHFSQIVIRVNTTFIFLKENGIWHRNILTPLTQRNDFGDIMDDLQEQELFTV